jgi:RNA polymerase sigma-70 factor (ECF subfamily)
MKTADKNPDFDYEFDSMTPAQKVLTKYSDGHYSMFPGYENILMAMEFAIDELNEEQKTCVTLFYLKKKSYQEIAASTGFSLLQVKSHIQNGKRNLKLAVEKKLNKH